MNVYCFHSTKELSLQTKFNLVAAILQEQVNLETIDQAVNSEESSKVYASVKKTGKLKQDTKLISLFRSPSSSCESSLVLLAHKSP